MVGSFGIASCTPFTGGGISGPLEANELYTTRPSLYTCAPPQEHGVVPGHIGPGFGKQKGQGEGETGPYRGHYGMT